MLYYVLSLNRQWGTILIITLIMMSIITSVLIFSLENYGLEQQMNANLYHYMQAHLLAESSINNFLNHSQASANMTMKIISQDQCQQKIFLTSAGEFSNTKVIIQTLVQRPIYPLPNTCHSLNVIKILNWHE